MDVLASLIYAGGVCAVWHDRGFASLFWPVGLGWHLAEIANEYPKQK